MSFYDIGSLYSVKRDFSAYQQIEGESRFKGRFTIINTDAKILIMSRTGIISPFDIRFYSDGYFYLTSVDYLNHSCEEIPG